MNRVLIVLLLIFCIWLILRGVSRRGKIYEYPFLAGATFLGFVLPQVPSLAADPFLPSGALAKTLIVTLLCAIMCVVGWAAGRRPLNSLNWAFDERRLLWLAAILSLVGGFFFFKLSRLPIELRPTNQMWTGLPVMYLFFARLLTYGLAIAALCFARRPSKFALGIILLDTLFYADRILIAGRRGEAADFFFILALALWFHRGFAIPRGLMLVGVFAGTLVLSSTHQYRAVTAGQDDFDLAGISKVEWISNFNDLIREGGPEMRNATMIISDASKNVDFDFGAFNWNTLVFNFVPAQIVGNSFKESLMLSTGINRLVLEGYTWQPGSTNTGMADAFMSFWYFGAVKFFAIAYLLGRIYRSAFAGNTVYQLVYMLTLQPAMVAITHHTQWVPSTWVHMVLLLLPFLVLARVNGAKCVSRAIFVRRAAVSRSPV